MHDVLILAPHNNNGVGSDDAPRLLQVRPSVAVFQVAACSVQDKFQPRRHRSRTSAVVPLPIAAATSSAVAGRP